VTLPSSIHPRVTLWSSVHVWCQRKMADIRCNNTSVRAAMLLIQRPLALGVALSIEQRVAHDFDVVSRDPGFGLSRKLQTPLRFARLGTL
jgi:hypothetical protein